MRSYLFVPADSERKLEKSLQSSADCLLIDLEDSVSIARKETARTLAAAFVEEQHRTKDRSAIVIRINSLTSAMADDDLAALVPVRPDGVLLPKSEHGVDVQKLSAMIAVHEARSGIEHGNTDIHALITETATGLLNAATYGGASDRLKSVSWGAEDLSADLGVETNRDDKGHYTDVFRLARTSTLLAAASAGVMAVDTVYVDFRNEAGLETECREAVRDGFSGKMAIHPNQVEIINRVFTPSPEAIEKALRIVSLFEQSGPDAGVLSLDGKMIDRPHLRQAERLLSRARDAGVSP
ncbi:CoA ester lyase [Hoeflea sp. WL0058]|uniref:CoA ester lyase n=1 Tax=Flavimaribacter sediminis TaxID=2865987 RepID=A0AAE3D0R8_9HYPH|nr:CoA ester lyase [Flavimaribacter sediminis]MBW8637056.1 CoA ester lyase [Flavimaribacter sediminis]